MPELGVVQNVGLSASPLFNLLSPQRFVLLREAGKGSQFVCLKKGMLFDSFSWTKNHCKNWWQGFVPAGRGEAAQTACLIALVMALLHGIEIRLADRALLDWQVVRVE